MSLNLPTAIAAYFDAANGGDAESGARCFSDDAVVLDEGKQMHGRAAIEAWMRANHQQYAALATPRQVSGFGDHFSVVAQVAGTFSGSPLSLHFHFKLAESGISMLEIVL